MNLRLALAASIILGAILGVVAAAGAGDSLPDGVGIRAMTVAAPERGGAIDVTLWYPAGPGGTPVLVGDGAVFKGVPARRDAPVADGVFPVVLVSHGGLRAAPHRGGWIASRMAARGFVVAVPHPPSLGQHDAAAAVREVWLRPADLSATLTALEQAPALTGRIVPDRVGVVGFLLGGTSALALAGARLDAEGYMASCDIQETGIQETGLDCSWFAGSGVDLHKSDAARLARSNADRRIAVAIAVDPELSTHLTPASLAAVTIPVTVVNLGRPGTIPPGLDAAGLETLVPGIRYETVPDATRFSSFSLCTPRGVAVLEGEGEDGALCHDGAGRSRQDIHTDLAARIGAALGQSLLK